MFFLFRNLDIEGQYEKNNTVDAEEKDVDLRRIIFGVSCVIAVSLDPLFFYVPVIEEDKKCIGLDKKLRFISLIMRSVTDIIGVINIILQLNDNGFKEEKFGKAKLLKHRQKKARRYFWLYVLIDIFVILPFPQVRESFLQLINLFMEKSYFITMMIIIFYKIN